MALLFDNWVFISKGLVETFKLAGVSLLCATLLAVVLGTVSLLRVPYLGKVIRGAVELFRAVPLIVNIFFFYFVAPTLGMDLSPFASVSLGLSLWGGANGTEIVRGGLTSISAHQWQSARALGLTTWQVFRFIVWPQALKSILPPYAGLLTLMVQGTSLGALVGVGEFLRTGQIIVERTAVMQGESPAFVVYSAVLLTYFVICSCISQLSRHLERRFRAAAWAEAPRPLRME
ncbi:MAG TPA: amino acid ABC transporter permease [Usitatibacter sp.]|nr:amino acid ABC transporter permease [Usitatibacter sp.]